MSCSEEACAATLQSAASMPSKTVRATMQASRPRKYKILWRVKPHGEVSTQKILRIASPGVSLTSLNSTLSLVCGSGGGGGERGREGGREKISTGQLRGEGGGITPGEGFIIGAGQGAEINHPGALKTAERIGLTRNNRRADAR